MITDGRNIANGTLIRTRVCIIGSGPAGITAAWELQKAGIDVTLIEGSRAYPSYQDSWPDKYLLYNGVSDGLFTTNEPEFLVLPYVRHQNSAWERERFYGGTSTHWGGQSRPEDPIDLEARPGFPGWPVTRADLDPYYAQASKLCVLNGDYKLNGENFSNEYWAKMLQAQIPVLDGFDVEMYQFVGGKYLNFATRTFDGITIGQSPVNVIVNASLLDINHQQGEVVGLRVASMDQSIPPKKATEFTVRADVYVLACGAVANARQLLLSNAGNENDQVGRYFMCHPLSQSNQVIISNYFLTSDQARLMNGETPTGKWTDSNGVQVTGRFIPNAEQTRKLGIGRCWFWYVYGQYYFEMAPNPESRITLTDTLDPVFGQRQTRATWELTDLDQKTYNQTTALYQAAVNKLGGTVSYQPWTNVKSQLVVNGHHMGTTRMHNDPQQGVVDVNLKVHSLKNLYCAGASVFPSAGISNPTFTIITLSIRLADHLRKLLT
jgi:choline dehydrogenase-like flavoprotein